MKRVQLKHVVLLFVIVVAGAAAVAWSVISRGFSAREDPSRLETFVARWVLRVSIPSAARGIRNPVEASPEALDAAMAHFADHCASCHGNDGRGKTPIGRGLYPKPPDMSQATTQELTDGEIYYIIENGIRWTGMPAFGEEMGNAQGKESWELVHFIRHLPGITDDELVEMKKMNPKSPMELSQEEKMRKFLQGDDSGPAEESHQNHR